MFLNGLFLWRSPPALVAAALIVSYNIIVLTQRYTISVIVHVLVDLSENVITLYLRRNRKQNV